MTKYTDPRWDYRDSDTKEYTHCFHNYPAMMIPQIARALISKYGKNASLLFDPYCGTGTSLVEANLVGIDAIGTDLNPLARLISRAKTNDVDLSEIARSIGDYNNHIFEFRMGIRKLPTDGFPDFDNIDYWFDPAIISHLSVVSDYISNIENLQVKDFFLIAFSETVRESSWTRNSEFKLYRMSEKQLEKFNPDVFKLMETKLTRNHKGLVSYLNKKIGNASTKVCAFNTVESIPEDVITANSIDIVVTSPPYGDSRTTVAYGQFSRLSNQWLGINKANHIDKRLMGGIPNKENVNFNISHLDDVLSRIREKDPKRVTDVTSFYLDYLKSINNVASVVNHGGHVCYVVGNRRVKGEFIETDEITKAMFENQGFKHIETIIRNIPNKRMPSRNCPTNLKGNTDSTMTNEYIVVLKKL